MSKQIKFGVKQACTDNRTWLCEYPREEQAFHHMQIARKPELHKDKTRISEASEQGISHAFLAYMLIRPDRSLKQATRADGQAVVDLQSCSSEHAKVRNEERRQFLKSARQTRKVSHRPDLNGQMSTGGANAGR